MPDYSKIPSVRTTLPHDQGARLDTRDYNITSADGAREALARVNSMGSVAEKTAVRDAVAKFWPDIGKPNASGDTRDYFPNSNMEK